MPEFLIILTALLMAPVFVMLSPIISMFVKETFWSLSREALYQTKEIMWRGVK